MFGQQVQRALTRIAALTLCLSMSCSKPQPTGMGELSATMYTRADTNGITVYSPRTRVAAKVTDELSLEATHTLDAWSGASIDVRTAATAAIHEVRNEVRAGAAYTGERLSVTGSYRYSTETDYWSHGAAGSLGLDLAQHNTQLLLSGYGGHDTVGRADDPGFRRPLRQLGAQLTLTQVIDKHTIAQLGLEATQLHGFQSSPYRFVAVGGRGTCHSEALNCRPEYVPEDRYRYAVFARVRRALSKLLSAGVSYRFYVDSWGLQSQTVSPDLRLLLGETGMLELDYRFYTQSEASFYRPQYFASTDGDGYFSRDRELSALYSNRIGLSYLYTNRFRDERLSLTAGVRSGVTRYRYLAFVGLSQVDALEATVTLSLGL